jgi:hypothetical protein
MNHMIVLFTHFWWSILLSPTQGKQAASIQQSKKDSVMTEIIVHVGKAAFTTSLYDNPPAKTLLAKLPLSITMKELNSNEKYYYFPDKFPVNAGNPGTIEAGDLMLYGNNCLVLFYESLNTPYAYTKLGRIHNIKGLAAALGSGDIAVTIEKK